MGSSATEPLAEVRDMQELHRALRSRAGQLNISRETIDFISGLQAGYSAKLEAAGLRDT